jgi:hypothetical protein
VLAVCVEYMCGVYEGLNEGIVECVDVKMPDVPRMTRVCSAICSMCKLCVLSVSAVLTAVLTAVPAGRCILLIVLCHLPTTQVLHSSSFSNQVPFLVRCKNCRVVAA